MVESAGVEGRAATLLSHGLAGPVQASATGVAVVGHGPVAAGLRAELAGRREGRGRRQGAGADAGAGTDHDGVPTGLTVEVHQQVVPLEAALRSGPHLLPVVVQPRRVVVGPLVDPAAGPCLHCLDLARLAMDPGWAGIVDALGHPVHQTEPVPVSAALVQASVGLVLLMAGSVLAGRPPTPGTAHEVGPDPPHVVTRRWVRHPRCRRHGHP